MELHKIYTVKDLAQRVHSGTYNNSLARKSTPGSSSYTQLELPGVNLRARELLWFRFRFRFRFYFCPIIGLGHSYIGTITIGIDP